jgi:AraC family transcriptional regulator, regulatory protein of adaptative response / methylated-DNA-[protein]-cysteine methyltransferase
MKLDPERWNALERRDRAYDGTFVYGVLTTGVYCRPSCGSRLPKPENVRFYPSGAEAEADGLRACKRCQPGANPTDTAQRIRDLCLYMEAHTEETLSLEHLGERAGLSPHHLQRTFKAQVGVSPKQYQDQLRLERFKQSLRQPDRDVTRSIFDAGYGSLSRVYEKLDTRLGMTPMAYRRGGAGIAISYASSVTPLGRILLGATDRGLCFLQFGESDDALLEELRKQYPAASLHPMTTDAQPAFRAWMEQLNQYLEGRRPGLDLPVHVRATAFQFLVWNHLQTIPAGQVKSYSEVASAIGRPGAARAVARACASNTVALAIPCHRVIRAGGGLGGYRWGLARKRTVLDLERQADRAAG